MQMVSCGFHLSFMETVSLGGNFYPEFPCRETVFGAVFCGSPRGVSLNAGAKHTPPKLETLGGFYDGFLSGFHMPFVRGGSQPEMDGVSGMCGTAVWAGAIHTLSEARDAAGDASRASIRPKYPARELDRCGGSSSANTATGDHERGPLATGSRRR